MGINQEDPMFTFARLDRLPPYVFATVNEIKMEARRAGKDIIDLGMGNPDLGTPQHIVDKLVEASLRPTTHGYSASKSIPRLHKEYPASAQGDLRLVSAPLCGRVRSRLGSHRHHWFYPDSSFFFIQILFN